MGASHRHGADARTRRYSASGPVNGDFVLRSRGCCRDAGQPQNGPCGAPSRPLSSAATSKRLLALRWSSVIRSVSRSHVARHGVPVRPERGRRPRRIAEREVESDQDPPTGLRRDEVVEERGRLEAGGEVDRVRRSIEAGASAPDGIPAEFRRAGRAPVDDDVDVERCQPAQLTMVAMTAKWKTAATTVKLCHTSW